MGRSLNGIERQNERETVTEREREDESDDERELLHQESL